MRRVQAATVSQSVSFRALQNGVLGRDRSLPHFGRKFYHLLMGLMCFSIYAFIATREQALALLISLGGLFVAADFIRLRFKAVNFMALRMFGSLMRREELKSFSGNSFYVLGLLTVVFLFPKPIVLLSVLFLAIGDPAAAVVGTCFGKHKLIGKKSVEGAGANFVLTAGAAFLFGMLYLGMSPARALILAVVGGTTSMLAELCPAPIDDNFSIPVLSAILLSLASPLIF